MLVYSGHVLWLVLQVKKMYRKACLSVHPDKVTEYSDYSLVCVGMLAVHASRIHTLHNS